MRSCLALLIALAGCRGRPAAPILNYHAVGAGGSAEFAVSEAGFDRQLDWLQSAGFRTVSLREVAAGHAPARAVALTFDDGTEDALTRVLPALRRRGMHGAFFIATALVGTPGYLSWDGVRSLAAAGMEVGSHTVHHARLADLGEAELKQELVDSKRTLEAELGAPVDLLAYPFNSVRRRVREAAWETGYRIGVSGVVHGGAEAIDLRRITVTPSMTLEQFQQAVQLK